MSAQSLAALDLANEVRQRHAAVKREIASGETTVAEVLFTRRHEVESMTTRGMNGTSLRVGYVQAISDCLRAIEGEDSDE